MPCNCADRRGHHLLGDFRTSPHETRLISGLLTAIVCWLVFPWFWLSLARFDESKGADEQSGNILLRLIFAGADGLLIPLMFAFSAVIHVYVARIPVSGEFPKGQIGWIVPVYLVAGYGVFLLSAGPSTLLPRMRSVFRLSWAASTVVPTILLARPHPCVSVPMA